MCVREMGSIEGWGEGMGVSIEGWGEAALRLRSLAFAIPRLFLFSLGDH